MVVPAVGVVIEDDHGDLRPFRALLQRVDDMHEEILLVERVGIAGMAVLERRCLQEAHRRQVVGTERIEEVVNVVIVVGRLRRVGAADQAVPDRLDRTRTRVRGIAGRLVILEPGVVRDVVYREEGRRSW